MFKALATNGIVSKEILDMATEDIKYHRLRIGYPISAKPLMTYKDDVLVLLQRCQLALSRIKK